MPQPTRADFRALAADYTVVPVWRELVADLTTPVAAFARIVGDDAGFLLESVENGERWSRFSFIGRNPLATLTARGTTVALEGELHPDVPLDQGILGALESMLEHYRSPALADLPPLHGGLMGYLGYDVVREVEHLPDVPRDDQGLPDAVLSVIGQLAVFDHWRQRVSLIDNVVVPPGASTAQLDLLYDGALASSRDARGRWCPSHRRAVPRTPVARRPLARGLARRCRASSTAARSKRPRSTSGPATSSRSCSPSAWSSSSEPIPSTSTGFCAR